jgi:hypothetical protein
VIQNSMKKIKNFLETIMAFYAFDGTWAENEDDTNVVKFCNAYTLKEICREIRHSIFLFLKIAGGAFGAGGKQRIREMYDEVCVNYSKVDKNIDVIGFS